MALKTAAVISARDEAATLAETLRALQSAVDLSLLIVVDDGSRDATAEIARTIGAEVFPASPPGKAGGKGHAIRRGLLRARAHDPDAVLLADADLGGSAARLVDLLAILDEHHPVAVAAFPPAIARRTGYAPAEPLSGQRALLAYALEALPGIAPGFGAEVGMTLDLLLAGIEPLELQLPLTHRPTGRNLPGFAHRARQGLDVARALGGTRVPW